MKSKGRVWWTRRRGTGYLLALRDHCNYVFTVEPTDQEDGDDLETVRTYIGMHGMPGDVYWEEGRPHLVQYGVVEEEPKEFIRLALAPRKKVFWN